MKNFKILLTMVAFFFLIGATTAQDAKAVESDDQKIENKAQKRVNSLNKRLTSVGEGYALTDDQKAKALEIYKKGFADIAAAKQGLETKEEKKAATKPIRMEMNTAINNSVLTKAQLKALRRRGKHKAAAKKMKKEDKN